MFIRVQKCYEFHLTPYEIPQLCSHYRGAIFDCCMAGVRTLLRKYYFELIGFHLKFLVTLVTLTGPMAMLLKPAKVPIILRQFIDGYSQ